MALFDHTLFLRPQIFGGGGGGGEGGVGGCSKLQNLVD